MIRAADAIRKVAKRCYPNYLNAFENGDALLSQFGITTPLRVAHFLAQFLHETDGGTVLFENMSYKTPARLLEIFGVGHHSAAIRPDEVSELLGNPEALAERVYGLGNPKKAAELGNTRPGDGYRYRGGGVLQTTGGGNYQLMGDKVGVDFYNNPDLIVAPEQALKPALHEWAEKNLNVPADQNDIRKITKGINGGYNGLDSRQAWFDKVWPLLSGDDSPAMASAAPDDDVRWLQESLNDLGATPPILVDGRYGPETTKAVMWFQSIASLKVDGIAGEVTRAAIKLRLAA